MIAMPDRPDIGGIYGQINNGGGVDIAPPRAAQLAF